MSNDNENFEELELIEEDSKDLESSAEEILKSKVPIEAIGEGEKINLFFRSTIGPERTEKLSVGKKTDVMELKETLGHVFDLSPSDFHLTHLGRTWDAEDTVGNFELKNGDIILLIPVSTAGLINRDS